jgi:hypothetical protein
MSCYFHFFLMKLYVHVAGGIILVVHGAVPVSVSSGSMNMKNHLVRILPYSFDFMLNIFTSTLMSFLVLFNAR